MKMWPYLVLLCIFTFAPVASQAQEVQKRPVALTWKYDAQQKKLTLHLVNNSGKDITAYSISMLEKYADGSTNPSYADGIAHDIHDHQRVEDMLGALLNSQN